MREVLVVSKEEFNMFVTVKVTPSSVCVSGCIITPHISLGESLSKNEAKVLLARVITECSGKVILATAIVLLD